jgi:hypothetical protein
MSMSAAIGIALPLLVILAMTIVGLELTPGDLDYAGLLDLIFAHDHVITW